MENQNEKPTPLLTWLRAANADQREQVARLAGTSVNYLYQLAGCNRGARLTAQLAFAIEDAVREVNRGLREKLPVVTARELTTMCALDGLGAS